MVWKQVFLTFQIGIDDGKLSFIPHLCSKIMKFATVRLIDPYSCKIKQTRYFPEWIYKEL